MIWNWNDNFTRTEESAVKVMSFDALTLTRGFLQYFSFAVNNRDTFGRKKNVFWWWKWSISAKINPDSEQDANPQWLLRHVGSSGIAADRFQAALPFHSEHHDHQHGCELEHNCPRCRSSPLTSTSAPVCLSAAPKDASAALASPGAGPVAAY